MFLKNGQKEFRINLTHYDSHEEVTHFDPLPNRPILPPLRKITNLSRS